MIAIPKSKISNPIPIPGFGIGKEIFDSVIWDRNYRVRDSGSDFSISGFRIESKPFRDRDPQCRSLVMKILEFEINETMIHILCNYPNFIKFAYYS